MILLMKISARILANSTDTDIHKKQLISADTIADPIIGTPLIMYGISSSKDVTFSCKTTLSGSGIIYRQLLVLLKKVFDRIHTYWNCT